MTLPSNYTSRCRRVRHNPSSANVAGVEQYYRPCGCQPLEPPIIKDGIGYCRNARRQVYVPRANRTITTGGGRGCGCGCQYLHK